MRFDLELSGTDGAGRKLTMRTSVYASSQEALQSEANKAAEIGPWFDESGREVTPENSLTIESVRPLKRNP